MSPAELLHNIYNSLEVEIREDKNMETEKASEIWKSFHYIVEIIKKDFEEKEKDSIFPSQEYWDLSGLLHKVFLRAAGSEDLIP